MSNTKTIMGQASNQYVDPTDSSDLFSTFLYNGTGAVQTITNGIDLAGKGGMTWIKLRNSGSNNELYDTERGVTNSICANTTNANIVRSTSLTSFNSNGFTLGAGTNVNANNYTVASWTWRKAPKYFDVVTYTGTGSTKTISHNLGSVPGMIIVKRTDATADWGVYHRQLNGGTDRGHWRIKLNSTGAQSSQNTFWNNTAPTDSVFTVGTSTSVNASGGTYVAYVFAHNNSDGGFGPTYDQDIIKCGSYTGNGSSQEINIGFEPQWIMVKNTSNSADWVIFDEMRNFIVSKSGSGDSTKLSPNTSDAEQAMARMGPSPTGIRFDSENGTVVNTSSNTYIYMAIRRGPLVPPTAGTEVFAIHNQAGAYSSPTNVGFPVDLSIMAKRTGNGNNSTVGDRLRGSTKFLSTSKNSADDTGIDWQFDLQNNFQSTWTNDTISWMWKRAPSYFDVVCYSGTGANRTVSHNLTVPPEMMWVKGRTLGSDWRVYHKSTGNTKQLRLNETVAASSETYWNNTTPTSSVFSLDSNARVNGSGETYIAYLFATLAGVSKVGSYTGNGSSQTINAGFTAGARFILIKRTDSTGDYYVWDTARGIIAGNDPHLSLNTTAAQVSDDSIDPHGSGFIVNQISATNINVSSAAYIFYAIA